MKKVCKIFSAALLTLLAAAILTLVAPRLFGVKLYSVLSGSMEPAYSKGDLIYVFPEDASDIETGDVITFLLGDDGTVATHRVIEVDTKGKQFYTKGDANEIGDGRPVKFENVLGKVKFSIPVVGFAIGYMTTLPGKIVTITIILAVILLIFLLQTQIDSGEEEYEEEAEKPVSRKHKRKLHVVKEDTKESYRDRPRKEKPYREKAYTEKPHREKFYAEKPYTEKPYTEKPGKAERKQEKEEAPAPLYEAAASAAPEPERRAKDVFEKKRNERNQRNEREQTRAAFTVARREPARALNREELDTSADYKYQKLQVCYKMLTLMETMWDDTMNGKLDEASEPRDSSEVVVYDTDEADVWDSCIDYGADEGGEESYGEEESGYTVS